MTEAALTELEHGPTVALMTRRRASEPPSQTPPQPADAVSASSGLESSVSQTKPRSKSSGSVANSENVSGGNNAAKPAARGGAAKARDGILTLDQNHPEDACRYPNKRCYNKRAVKNNGELHKFCDKHRDSANRYQRKLEQRLKEKRIQSRMHALQARQAQAQVQAQTQAQAQAQMAHAQAHGHTPFGVVGPAIIGTSNSMLVSPYPGMEMYGGAAPHGSSGVIGSQISFPRHPAAVAPALSGYIPTQGEDDYEPFQHPVQLQNEDLDCLNLLFLEH